MKRGRRRDVILGRFSATTPAMVAPVEEEFLIGR